MKTQQSIEASILELEACIKSVAIQIEKSLKQIKANNEYLNKLRDKRDKNAA